MNNLRFLADVNISPVTVAALKTFLCIKGIKLNFYTRIIT
jgi:hypothetical protein